MRRPILAAVAGIGLAASSGAAVAQDVMVETYVAPAPRYYSYPPPVVAAPPPVVYDAPGAYYEPRYRVVRRYYYNGYYNGGSPRRINCDSRYRLGECVIERSQE